MTKFYAALLILIFASLAAVAQQPNANERADAQTNRFAPADEEFSIESPPIALVPRVQFGIEKFSRRYDALVKGNYFFVFSDALKMEVSADDSKTGVSIPKANLLAQDKVVSSFIKSSQATGTGVYVNDFAGEKFAFADADGFFYKILTVKTARRAYVFQTVSQSENDADVERFFAGIQFQGKSPVEQKSAPVKNKQVVADPKIDEKDVSSGMGTGAGRGQGSGSGRGSGSGIGNGASAGNAISADANQTTPLSLEAKPRANYTDFARFYQITGTVRTRVTFLPNGTIGDVILLTKLPFGLSENALEAARAIQFKPPNKNGQPYSITKIIEYSFSIY